MGSLGREMAGGHLWRVMAGRAALVLLVLLTLVVVAPKLSFVEVRALDVLFALRPSREPDPRVAVVDIGTDPREYDSLRDPRESRDDGCEVPRLAYAEAVRRLDRWGARVIVFDLYFSKRCEYEDERLAQVFREAGNVIVAATTKTKPGAVGLEDPMEPIGGAVWAVGSPVGYQPGEAVRSIPLLVRDRDTGKEYLALSLVAFECYRGEHPGEARIESSQTVLTCGERVPVLPGEEIYLLGSGGEPDRGDDASPVVEVVQGGNVSQIPRLTTWTALLVNWAGPGGTIRPHYLADLLAMDDDQGRALFRDKAVVIGKGDWDAHWTAVGAMPGPEIQANALGTLISADFLRPVSPWGMLGVLAAFVLATSAAARRFKGARALPPVLVLMVAALLLARHLLVARGVWLYLFYTELGIGLTWGATTVAESGKVTGLLARFVPSFIGRPETRTPGEIRTMDASILFSDIRGYTGLAEQLSAADTLAMLNTFQSALEDIITSHGGTIVKTPGDAILAVFWKDVRGLSHAACALQSGRDILGKLPALGRSWEARGVTLAIGIGIDAGEVAMGLVGKRHLEPTVIGDSVNVAQRLEVLTKTLNCPLIFSENVRERLREEVEATCFDAVTVKGREAPLRVYGVSDPNAPRPEADETVDPAAKEKTA